MLTCPSLRILWTVSKYSLRSTTFILSCSVSTESSSWTSTASCARIGPASTSFVATWTVQPVTRTALFLAAPASVFPAHQNNWSSRSKGNIVIQIQVTTTTRVTGRARCPTRRGLGSRAPRVRPRHLSTTTA